MDIVMQILPYIGAASLTVLFIIFFYYAGGVLIRRHESDIRVVSYFYSLTVVVSHLIGIWAVNANAINRTGNFEGELGAFIHALLKSTLDINLSLSIIISIFTLILLPQIISYLLSGLFGVAATPKYISQSMSILMWGAVKTFIVVSGVTSTILVFGLILSWESFSVNNVVAWFVLSLALCLFSFLVLLIYRGGRGIVRRHP